MPRNEIRCACAGRIEEGKSRCTKRITRKGKKFSAQAFAHLIPDYDYVKDDSLSEKCYERLRKEKIATLASQEHCVHVCQGRTTDPGAKCRVKRSEDDSSCSAGGFEETIQARDSGYKYVEGDLLFPALGRFQAELNTIICVFITCGVCGIRDFASRPLEDTYVSIDKFRGSLLLSEEEARLHQALSPLARSVRKSKEEGLPCTIYIFFMVKL